MYEHKKQPGTYTVPKCLIHEHPHLFQIGIERAEVLELGMTLLSDRWQLCKSDVIMRHYLQNECLEDSICSMTLSGVHSAPTGQYRLDTTLPFVLIRKLEDHIQGSNLYHFDISPGFLVLRLCDGTPPIVGS